MKFSFKRIFKRDKLREHIFKNSPNGWVYATLKRKVFHSYKNKPAVMYGFMSKHWYKNGVKHRINGPAAIHQNGVKDWYLNGRVMGERDHKKQVYRLKWRGKKKTQ